MPLAAVSLGLRFEQRCKLFLDLFQCFASGITSVLLNVRVCRPAPVNGFRVLDCGLRFLFSLDGRLCHGAERRTDHAEKLAGLVGRRTTSGWKWLALVLDRLLYAGMRDVIVIAEFAERIPAALQLAIRTNQSSTVGALSHGGLTVRYSLIAITRYVFDLTVHFPPLKPIHNNASRERVPCGARAQIALRGPRSGNSHDS